MRLLPWAEAEAVTLAALAETLGAPGVPGAAGGPERATLGLSGVAERSVAERAARWGGERGIRAAQLDADVAGPGDDTWKGEAGREMGVKGPLISVLRNVLSTGGVPLGPSSVAVTLCHVASWERL